MKHLFAFTLAISSLSCIAQWPTLPYNPDDNADGLIGVADLQALLANYGNEFASAVVSEDGESAIVYMGNMGYPHCEYACENLPGFWTMPKLQDLVPVWLDVDGYGVEETWLQSEWKFSLNSTMAANNIRWPYYYGNSSQSSYAEVKSTPESNAALQCYCVAKQLPRVEYSYCSGNDPALDEEFNQCITDKLAEGWYPLEGFPNHHDRQGYVGYSPSILIVGYQNNTHASFWRWAE